MVSERCAKGWFAANCLKSLKFMQYSQNNMNIHWVLVTCETLQNALLAWTELTCTGHDSIFQVRLILRQLSPRSCSWGWVEAWPTSGSMAVAVEISKHWVEHEAVLEEPVSRTGEVRVLRLCVCAALQYLVTILALLAYVKRGDSNCCFSAYLYLGWESWASLGNPRPKRDWCPRQTTLICVKANEVQEFSSFRCLPHWMCEVRWGDRTGWLGYMHWEAISLEVLEKLMVIILGFCFFVPDYQLSS